MKYEILYILIILTPKLSVKLIGRTGSVEIKKVLTFITSNKYQYCKNTQYDILLNKILLTQTLFYYVKTCYQLQNKTKKNTTKQNIETYGNIVSRVFKKGTIQLHLVCTVLQTKKLRRRTHLSYYKIKQRKTKVKKA